jgi:hypothetical protein
MVRVEDRRRPAGGEDARAGKFDVVYDNNDTFRKKRLEEGGNKVAFLSEFGDSSFGRVTTVDRGLQNE